MADSGVSSPKPRWTSAADWRTVAFTLTRGDGGEAGVTRSPRCLWKKGGVGSMAERVVAAEALDLGLVRLRIVTAGDIETMKRSLERKGQLSPVVAAEEDGRLELLDGFRRQAAAVALGWPSLRVDVVQLRPVERKAQLYVRNRERGLTLLEESLLVQELHRVDGLSQVEIAELVERHKSWVCRRLQFVETLSPYLLEDMRVGLLEAGSARRLAALPAGNQEEAAAAVQRHRLSPTETGRLVKLWQRAPDEATRQFVLTHPKEALSVASGKPEEPSEDPRLSPRARQALRSLRVVRAAAERLRQRCEEGIDPLEVEGAAVLREALTQAREATRQAWVRVEAAVGPPHR